MLLAASASFGLVLTIGLPAFAVPVYTGGIYRDLQVLATGVSSSVGVPLEGFEVVNGSVFPNGSVFFTGSSAVSNVSLLAAARSQLGWGQDCTALVENALRALGYEVGDLGPWGFVSLGRVVPHGEALPGDLLIRGGHVAVYAGGGVAVHGGFNGFTVESSVDGDPFGYVVVVRVG